MSLISSLLDRIEHHCAVAGIAETTFGRFAVNDGKFVARLRAGRSMTLRTLDRVERFLNDAEAQAKQHEVTP
jgi:hypothetical protein